MSHLCIFFHRHIKDVTLSLSYIEVLSLEQKHPNTVKHDVKTSLVIWDVLHLQ